MKAAANYTRMDGGMEGRNETDDMDETDEMDDDDKDDDDIECE